MGINNVPVNDMTIFRIERDDSGRKIVVIPEKFVGFEVGSQVWMNFAKISYETMAEGNRKRRKTLLQHIRWRVNKEIEKQIKKGTLKRIN